MNKYELSGQTEEEWEKEASDMIKNYAPRIFDCKKCGHPYPDGFVCLSCMDMNPEEPPVETFTVYLTGKFTSSIQISAPTHDKAAEIARILAQDTLISNMETVEVSEVTVSG